MSRIGFILLSVGVFFYSCASSQKQIEVSLNPKVKKAQEEFFNSPEEDLEVFRIFVSSENYIIKQIANDGEIEIKPDPNGDMAFTEDISKYDLVDLFSEAVYSVELYSESGKIAKIRPVRPARVSELNKLIADDITRLRFVFPKGEIQPVKFYIRYGILLQKKMTEAERRKLLEENVR